MQGKQIDVCGRQICRLFFDSQTDSINIRIPRKIECRQREKQSVSGLSPGMFLSWKSQLQSSRIYYLVYRKGEKKKPAKEDVVLLVFFATFLWANFAAMPMMNDCEKSARHLWLLWLMNTKMVPKIFQYGKATTNRTYDYHLH